MGFLEQLRSSWSGPLTSSSPELARLWASPPVASGVSVNETTALNYSAFWAAVSLISSDVASLPLILYKRTQNGGKERYTDPKLYRILHDEPNPEMTSFVFRETLQGHVLTWGNAYAEIERSLDDRVKALWPLSPDRVSPFREGSTLRYRVSQGPGKPDAVFEPRNILHIPGLGYDGTCGYSVVAKARESLGLGIAAERFGASFYGNGSTMGGVFEHPGRMSPAAQKNFREATEARHQGVDRAHRFLVVEEGMKFQKLGIPPDEAQFLETRKFQVEEIARWFKLPPHKIGAMEHATFSNIEHQNLEYYKSCLLGWLRRWEQELNRKLIAPMERNIQFAEHLVDGFLRADIATRYAAYAIGRNGGWLNADDIRRMENLNPLPGGQGEIYLVPMNMVPADMVGDVVKSQIKKNETPTPAPQNKDDDAAKAANARAEAAERSLAVACADVERQVAELDALEQRLHESDEALNVQRERVAEAQGRVAVLTPLVEDIKRERDMLEAQRAEDAKAAAEAIAEVEARADKQLLREADGYAKALAEQEAALRTAETTAAAWKVDAVEAERLREAAEAAKAVAVQNALTEVQTREEAEKAAEAARIEAFGADVARAAAEHRATTEAAEKAAALEALAAQKAAEQIRLQRVLTAHRALIADAMGRMIRRETEKARAKQATPQKLRAWMDSFYPVHEDVCRAALLPAIRTHLAWQGSDADPAEMTATLVSQHVQESIRQLRLVLDTDPEDISMGLETLLRRWELERPDVIADHVLREAIRYVGSQAA